MFKITKQAGTPATSHIVRITTEVEDIFGDLVKPVEVKEEKIFIPSSPDTYSIDGLEAKDIQAMLAMSGYVGGSFKGPRATLNELRQAIFDASHATGQEMLADIAHISVISNAGGLIINAIG